MDKNTKPGKVKRDPKETRDKKDKTKKAIDLIIKHAVIRYKEDGLTNRFVKKLSYLKCFKLL